jgi:hypothetical protein
MSTASSFRGLVDVALFLFAAEDPNNPFMAAFPTFRKFTPPTGPQRDEVVILRRSAASAPTARQLGNMQGALSSFSENDIPAVFRALNPAATATTRGFPTFSYGRSGVKQYMNVVTLKPGFATIFMPVAMSPSPTDVEAFMAAAQTFAQTNGFTAGFPTFNVMPGGHEIVVFSTTSNAAVVNSSVAGGGGWSFTSLPAINDSGLAITSDGVNPILYNVFDGGLTQYRHSPPGSMLVQVDPFVDGSHQATGPIDSQVSAVRTGGNFHVIWSDFALFHGSRPDGLPDSFTFRTASGRTTPGPTGLVGYFNHLAVAPDGVLHALAYLSVPPGVPFAPKPDDMVGYNLLHLVFDGTSWSEEVVDGEAETMLGHVVGDAGQMSTLAFEPNGTMHAFYLLVVESTTNPGNFTRRLRHAQRTPAGWTTETLDGSGANAPPAVAGTGPTRADVGANPTAVFFDGSLWVIYEDRTWGNLRCARGTRNAAGVLEWDFHVVDGNAGFRRTTGVVQAAVAIVWENKLSLFYGDLTRRVMRHAWRSAGDAQWRYELLDGAGGPDGRIDTAVMPLIAACAGGTRPDGTSSRPLFVAYRFTGGTGSNTRLATLR